MYGILNLTIFQGQVEQEMPNDKTTPPKPPPPVLPQKPCLKSPNVKKFETPKYAPPQADFLEAGSESASSNVSQLNSCFKKQSIKVYIFLFPSF